VNSNSHMTLNCSLVAITLVFIALLVAAVGCIAGPTPKTQTPNVTPTTTTALNVTQIITLNTTSPSTPRPDIHACTYDADCVPEQCCHPLSCINKSHIHVCNELCTMVCQGPLDCGAGHCGCINRTCSVVPGTIAP